MSRKIKTLLLSLTPIAVYFIIEILVSCGCTFTGMIGMTAVSGTVFGNWLSGFLEQEGLYLISILAYLIFFVIGVFWYKRMRAGGKYPVWNQQKNLNLSVLLKLAVLGIFVQFAISFLLNLVYIVRPDVMQNYTKVMESLGSGNPSLFSVFYVVITAPIVEEMLMRGLCLVILRKEFPFWVANIIQAFYFGVIHLNLVQGIYAFLLGMVLGAVVKRYGTLKASMYLHFVINFSGQLLSCLLYTSPSPRD